MARSRGRVALSGRFAAAAREVWLPTLVLSASLSLTNSRRHRARLQVSLACCMSSFGSLATFASWAHDLGGKLAPLAQLSLFLPPCLTPASQVEIVTEEWRDWQGTGPEQAGGAIPLRRLIRGFSGSWLEPSVFPSLVFSLLSSSHSRSPPLLPAAHQLDNSAFDGWEPFGTWLDNVCNRAVSTLWHMIDSGRPDYIKEACGRRQAKSRSGGPSSPASTTFMAFTRQPVPTPPSNLAGTLISASDPFTPGARSRGINESVSEKWWRNQALVLDSPNTASFDDLPEHLKNFKEPFGLGKRTPAASINSYSKHQHSFPPDYSTPAHSEPPALYPMVDYAAHHEAYSAPTHFGAPTLESNAMFVEHGNLVQHHGWAPGWTQR
uniref:BY PROTMAP: gi/342320792/gb/EGU12731.1/ Proteophosphoglycan ppg4 [Rhodotorula glutinis ATCC 204091] n=1 Tax=Rhodotorula toruloides TaxID=5286 RepID=A0A0K3CQR6_RHOTO